MAKKSAIAGEYVVTVLDDGSIEVCRTYGKGNVRGVLREIAKQEGIDYDPEWNTRELGSKIIDSLNNREK